MSAIHAPGPFTLRSRPAETPLPRVEVPKAAPRVKRVRKARSRTQVANWVASGLMTGISMAGIAYASFLVSTVVGTVSLESAHQARIKCIERAASAKASESALHSVIDALGSEESMTQWATYSQFQSPYRLADKKVASKETDTEPESHG